jgi:SAM-dependent methyltransferase
VEAGIVRAGPSSLRFYDDLAEVYHLVYADWEDSVRRQAEVLDGLLARALGPGPHRILDVSCGIGTQALGLAALGHAVSGSDLSPRAIERARREAAARGLEIGFSVADMRTCDRHHQGPFDAVLSCDNSVPHLLTDEEILTAFRAFRRLARPGGAVLVSVRDYPREDRSTPQLRPYGIRETPAGRWLVFQTWDWDADGARYDLSMYFVRDGGGDPEVLVSRARSYAVAPETLAALLREAGFAAVERIDGVYYQPVLLAR